jgi:hypothetical protein
MLYVVLFVNAISIINFMGGYLVKINQLDLFGEKKEMIKGAFIDPTGMYRYNLWRE